MAVYSIGDLSLATGVKVTTIRYYEEMGLMDPPERSSGNQRRYFTPQLERLSFIKHARDLGMTIEAIGELIRLSGQPDMPCEEAHQIAKAHLKEIHQRLAMLKKLKKELTRITLKRDAGHIGECYVIQSLSQHELCESDH